MQKDIFYAIGLMSGTSLDGVDLVYVKFNCVKGYSFDIINSETFSYSNKWKQKLQRAYADNKDNLTELDIEYGQYLGKLINNFVKENQIEKIDFVASHGHTIFHKPDKGYTLQIGNGQEIANITKQKVVCDFRTQDIELGGQGAPLVPIGDELLFADYDFCLNLGGFANISFKRNTKRIAFDICPVNIVLNHYCRKLRLDYDDKGQIASAGIINHKLLESLNKLDFYKKASPKSLGLEWVEANIFPLIDGFKLEVQDVLRTFIEHIAVQIAKIISKSNSVLITGGGTFNDFLIGRIEYCSKLRVVLASKELIDYKEALIFAFLGLLKLQNKVNVLNSVTGAKKDHSSGKIFNPSNI